MIKISLFGLRHAAALLVPAILLTVSFGGCAGPAARESHAFERWGDRDRATYGGRHGQAAERGEVPEPVNAIELPENPGLNDYIQYAMAHNPGLESAFQEWKAALERVPQARGLPDPELGYGYYIRSGNQKLSLSQTFPWYGRLRAQSDAELEAAKAAEQRFESRRLALFAQVKAAHAEYAYLRQALDVMEENRRILAEFEEAARGRFEAGEVPYADLVRAEVAVEELKDEIATLEDRRRPLVAGLNAALGRPTHLQLPWPEPLEQPVMHVEEEQLLARLVRENPELRALDNEREQQRHLLKLARQNRIPDFTLGGEFYPRQDERDTVAIMVSINLPIWGGRLQAERAEALAGLSAASRQRTDRRNELQSELQLAYYRFADAQRRAALFEERLIPMARVALEATEAAYGEGQVEFRSLTEAQRDLLEMQLTYQRALADRFQYLAELERIAGREFSYNANRNPGNGDIEAEEAGASGPLGDRPTGEEGSDGSGTYDD